MAAVVLGQAGLLVVAVPFGALALLGVADRRPPVVGVADGVATPRVTQGSAVEATVTLRVDGVARHDLLLVPSPGLAVPPGPGLPRGIHVGEPSPAAALIGLRRGAAAARAGAAQLDVPWVLEAARWGRHGLGTLHVRSRRPWGLMVWDAVAPLAGEVRVLPPATRLSQLLAPAEPAGLAGPHPSRARGHGSDIAELRPYRPGDRLRDVSWAATARTGQPWVAEHHPQRTGTVVVLLDTAGEGTGPGVPGFDRLASTTWSLVSAHLRVGDRVGLLGAGPSVTWLPPAAGRRARLLLLDALLALAGPRRRAGGAAGVTRTLLPADALVIGVTMLQSEAFLAGLARHRRHGRAVLALVVDPTIDAPPLGQVARSPAGTTEAAQAPVGTRHHTPIDVVEQAARRLWRAELDRRRAMLAAAGVPSALVDGPGQVPAALRTLNRRPARSTLRRAR
jgi:uncharacterized protein (DUF58 family)